MFLLFMPLRGIPDAPMTVSPWPFFGALPEVANEDDNDDDDNAASEDTFNRLRLERCRDRRVSSTTSGQEGESSLALSEEHCPLPFPLCKNTHHLLVLHVADARLLPKVEVGLPARSRALDAARPR